MKGAAELEAADAVLAGLPASWLAGGLADAVLRRAVLQTAARLLAEQADGARAAAECAAAAVAGGALAALDELVVAEAELLAVDRAAARLPAPDLDPAAVQVALSAARAELDAADRALVLIPLDADVEVAAWRQSSRLRGEVYDPPVITDAERALSARAGDRAERVEQARTGSRAWRSDADRRAADPLDLLAAALGHIAAIEDLAGDVAALNAEVEAANAERADAGRTWRHPMSDLGVVR